jgi:hypothetical protein
MQNNEGTLIFSPIRPYNSGDTYATAYANEVKGGFHTVNTLIDRDNIPMERREEGMLCSVLQALSGLTTGSTNVIYQLIGGTGNTNWNVFNNGGNDVSSSDLIISDQNSGFQQSGIRQINFIGNNPISNVRVLPNGNSVVDVWIQSPTYVDKFNQGLAQISNIDTVQRYISSPILEGSPFYIGNWTGGTLQSVISSSTINFNTINFFSLENSINTNIVASIIRGDGALLATNTLIITGDTSETLNNITIIISNFSKDNYKWKARLNVSYNLSSLLPNGGRFSIKIQHNNTGDLSSPYIFEQNDIFFDSENNISTINGLFINENISNLVTRKLSGVEYYTTNSQFIVSLNEIDFINDKSFPNTILVINDNYYGLPQLNINVTGLTSWSTEYDNINASYNKNDWAINISNFYILTTYANINATVYDWTSGNTIFSSNNSIAIDTWDYNDDRISEDFTHEINRFKSDYITNWNSNNSLLSEDNGNGLQLSDSKLIYPNINYNSIYNPNKNSQPNYSGLTGDKYFIRNFWNSSMFSSNGIFLLRNHNFIESDIVSGSSMKILIEISIDTVNWFSLNNLYQGGFLSNGDGCRIENDVYNINNNQIQFTLGLGKFTKTLWFKITYLNNAKDKYIDGINLNGGNWV